MERLQLRRRACGPGSGDDSAKQCAAETAVTATGQQRRQCGLGSGDGCEDEGF